MTRVLSQLLDAEEPLFEMALQRLESASGQPSVDVRLTAEIIGKAHLTTKALGLDPSDSTELEVYRSLINMAHLHESFLAKRVGIEDPADVATALPRIIESIEALNIPKKAWVMKHSVARRLLKACPPKKVMKQLGYRSLESFLKRESVADIFGAMRYLESEEWLQKFINKYHTLKGSDFEVRPIEVRYLEPTKWHDAAVKAVTDSRHNVTNLKELGVIVVLPLPITRLPGVTLFSFAMLLHYINEIRMYSSYFKSQQMRPSFASTIVETLLHDPKDHAYAAGHALHWRTVQRHFARSGKHHDMFEPHVEPEDLAWRKAEETMFRLEPALHFWHDIDYVGAKFGDHVISFNMVDVAVNYMNQLPYGLHSVEHMRDALWNELYVRYMGQQAIETQVTSQFETHAQADNMVIM